MSAESSDPSAGCTAFAAVILGTWCYTSTSDPLGISFIHYSDTGRVVFFEVLDPQKPEKRWAIRQWYSVESPNRLRVRSKLENEGRLIDFVFDGKTLAQLPVFPGAPELIFTRPAPEQIPDWFPTRLAAALARP
jgi:hypothetical protein